jgi:hypothetical protein
MPSGTNVPVPTLGSTGYVIPSESAILAGVILDLQAAFGGQLNLSISNTASLSTPQGQLASSIAAQIADCYNQFLYFTTQTDPQYAQGTMQDAIGNIYFMTRNPATSTLVTGTVVGLSGTSLPLGTAVAQDAAGNLYSVALATTNALGAIVAGGAVTIGSGGSTSAVFINVVTGSIAYVGPLTIYQTIPGWDLISGTTQYTLGSPIENAQAFEIRRQNSVAANASNTSQAIKAAILSLTPLSYPSSVYVVDNPLSVSNVVGGITLPPNSVYVAAYGYQQSGWSSSSSNAVPIGVATAVWTKKSLGCTYAPSAIFVGSTLGTSLTVSSVTSGTLAIGQTLQTNAGIPYVTSAGAQITIASGSGTAWVLSGIPSGGNIAGGTTMWSGSTSVVYDQTYASSQPSYNVTFTVPVTLSINIQVTLASASNPPSNALALLQSSTGLQTAFSGNDGYAPVSQIGVTVYASRFYTTIAQVIPGASIVSVLIGTGSPTLSQVPVNINQIPVMGTITLVLA